MKRVILLILAGIFFSVNLYAKEVIVVTEAWPPYVFEENGEPTGFDYDVMMAVFDKMGYEVNFQFLPWKRCISNIESKKADAILDASFNEEREKFMYFPEEKMSDSSSVLFMKKGGNFKYDKIEDLKGLTIGTRSGYKYSEEFNNSTLFKKDEAESDTFNFKKLLSGRIDLMIMNKNVGLFTAKKDGFLKDIDYLKKPISGGDNYLAFSKKSGNDQLAKKFSDTLKSFKKTEEYKKI